VIGIYLIINKENYKTYVGSSIDVERRWKQHRSSLCRDKHDNSYLQNAWNKYGEENFIFSIIEELGEIILLEKVLKVEQWYLDNFISEYNINRKASGCNYFKGKKFTDEHRKNLSIAHSGELHHFYGKRRPEHSIKMIGRKVSKETRDRISKIHKGKVVSEETKRKISIAKGNLTIEQVKEIRKLYATKNYTQKELGKMFTISFQHVSRIVNNQVWRYIQ